MSYFCFNVSVFMYNFYWNYVPSEFSKIFKTSWVFVLPYRIACHQRDNQFDHVYCWQYVVVTGVKRRRVPQHEHSTTEEPIDKSHGFPTVEASTKEETDIETNETVGVVHNKINKLTGYKVYNGFDGFHC